jgi:chloramphenicol 3-O phosphotransferase
MMPAKVVVLNGVGSAGKSSIAKALQQITEAPFLHVEMDAFLAMLPERYQDHPDGLVFEAVTEDGAAAMAVRSGMVVERALKGMRHAVAALAGAGNNLIVDEVLFGDVATEYGNAVADYRARLAPYRAWFVGVMAPLDVLEARERQRGDRHHGLARWQFGRVHRGMTYDLEVDSGRQSPADCARSIKDRFGL